MSLFESDIDIDVDMYDLESICDPRHLTEFSLNEDYSRCRYFSINSNVENSDMFLYDV